LGRSRSGAGPRYCPGDAGRGRRAARRGCDRVQCANRVATPRAQVCALHVARRAGVGRLQCSSLPQTPAALERAAVKPVAPLCASHVRTPAHAPTRPPSQLLLRACGNRLRYVASLVAPAFPGARRPAAHARTPRRTACRLRSTALIGCKLYPRARALCNNGGRARPRFLLCASQRFCSHAAALLRRRCVPAAKRASVRPDSIMDATSVHTRSDSLCSFCCFASSESRHRAGAAFMDKDHLLRPTLRLSRCCSLILQCAASQCCHNSSCCAAIARAVTDTLLLAIRSRRSSSHR